MKNGIMVSVVIVFLVGSAAIAQITQVANWDLGLNSSLSVAGGASGASVGLGYGIVGVQSMGINPDENGDPMVTADQGFGLALFQAGSVGTSGAEMTLGQELTIEGSHMGLNPDGQAQDVGDLTGPIQQSEGVSIVGSQDLEKGEGSGAIGSGLNLAGFGMGQAAVNTCAEGWQASLILGGQYVELSGNAQASGEVQTDMNATITQYQEANN